MSDHQTVWSFDLGKGSIGEAVRDIKSNKFLHKASLLIPAEFASTKEAAMRRRMERTRLAHKAREKWLDEVWLAAGLEPLQTRKVWKNPKTRKWELKQIGDYRMEREFAPQNRKPGRDGAPADDTICYTSCLLRIKLLRGEKLEAWQIYKALHSAIQKRGYGRVPWAAREEKRRGKTEEEQEKELKKLDPDYREAVETWPKFKHAVSWVEFHLPCYYDAWKMGLWSVNKPDVLESRITCQAESTRKVRFDRADVEREISTLAKQAAVQLHQLADSFAKWKRDGWKSIDSFPVAAKTFGEFLVYGPAGEPEGDARNNFSDYLKFRASNKIHPGSSDDWMGATAQKTPRFDNRIINTCALIPRLQVCNVTIRFNKSDSKPIPESLLATEVTFLMKLKNTLVAGYPAQRKLTAEEIRKLFEVVTAEALAKALSVGLDDKYRERKVAECYALTKTDWARTKGIKELGLFPLPGHMEIKAPKTDGRSRFSRPALRLIRALILSGQSPSAFHQRLLGRDRHLITEIGMDVLDAEPVRFVGAAGGEKTFIKAERPWVVTSDLKFLLDLARSNDTWDNIYFPEQRLDALEARYTDIKGKISVPQAVRELLGSINDPVVKHRLGVFSDRLTKLQRGDDKEGIPACGIPETVVLEFVREDFMGERAKRELQKFISDREKARKEAGDQAAALGVHEKSGRLKYELFKSQGSVCLYCQQNFKETDLADYRIEHIVPRAQGGPDAMVNYVLAHDACNDAKGDRTPFEWKHGQQGWDGYKACVEKHGTLLRNKKVQLLLREDAAELVGRYTALAETAWITKLAQKIVSLHFGWPSGVDREGKRRVIAVSGGLTARIRRKYRLNSLLNPPPVGTIDLNEWEAKAEKNRKDNRHHALDAMVINFLPQWMRDEKKGWFFRFPEPVRKNPRATFEKEIADVMPRLLAFEKAPLAETIYGGRMEKGKTTIVQRVPLRKLAFNTIKQKEVFDRKYLAGQIKSVRDPHIAEMLLRFLGKESNGESEWHDFCEDLFQRRRDGTKGARISKINVNVGSADEYAEMSKDRGGAYRKGKKGHKGQIIYLELTPTKKGAAKEIIHVRPVYAFESRLTIERKLRKELGDSIKIYGFFQSGCLIAVKKEVAHDKKPLPAGSYLLNTIMADAKCMKVTTQNGVTYPDIPRYSLSSLIEAGLCRAD